MTSKPKKKNALATAASKKLAGIAAPRYSPEQMAHMMMHAEERGEAQRVPLDDGSWAWAIRGQDGKTQWLKPTPEMLEALHRFETHGHPQH